MRIYLDMCSLQRPLDDAIQLRVRVEAEAIVSVLAFCQAGKAELITSDALLFEASACPDRRTRNMNVPIRPLNEVNHHAIRLLTEQIGLADTFRFINQFTTGQGNYTEEREARFGNLTLDEIVSAINAKHLSKLVTDPAIPPALEPGA